MSVTWEILNIIGTVAFAVSGALVALDEHYDILGVFILGYATAFGGGLLRNLLIGLPVRLIWEQKKLFMIAFCVILTVFLLPAVWRSKSLTRTIILCDAIGLAAFSLQGANLAVSAEMPVIAVVMAALTTGAGGGLLRDLFATRKPMIFHSDIYALWAMLGGLFVNFAAPLSSLAVILGLVILTGLRLLSVHYRWNLPHRVQSPHH